jgi:small-conductance mechanosensitive channel
VRFRIPVGVSYNVDPKKVREVLLAVGRAHPGVLADPPPSVTFDRFGDNALEFQLGVWTTDSIARPSAFRSELNFAIWEAFTEHKIEVPFPQRDIHLRGGELVLKTVPGETRHIALGRDES